MNITKRDAFQVQRCPYLGLHDDRSTSLAYPSTWNYCYHATPPAPVLVSHQVEACLSPRFVHCPVYLTGTADPLPSSLRGPGKVVQTHLRSVLGRLMLLIFFAALITFLALLFFHWPFEQESSTYLLTIFQEHSASPGSQSQSAAVPTGGMIETISSPSFAGSNSSLSQEFVSASGTQSITNNLPTKVPASSLTKVRQTFTPTPEGACGHALDIPFGNDVQFLLHRVVSGENLTLYAEQYDTDTEAILAVNDHLPMPVWEDWILVVPFETTDVSGLPSFEPYQAIGANLSLSELAEQLNTDAQSLSKYNAFGSHCKVFSGWLLIPRKSQTP